MLRILALPLLHLGLDFANDPSGWWAVSNSHYTKLLTLVCHDIPEGNKPRIGHRIGAFKLNVKRGVVKETTSLQVLHYGRLAH